MKGLTTIHAGSARQALTRLRFVCQLAAVDLPMAALNTLVAEAIDVVVHCRRTDAGPRVAEIVAVEDLAGGAEATQFTITPLFVRDDTTSELTWTGQIPVRLLGQLRAAGVDLRALLEPSAGHGGRS